MKPIIATKWRREAVKNAIYIEEADLQERVRLWTADLADAKYKMRMNPNRWLSHYKLCKRQLIVNVMALELRINRFHLATDKFWN